LPVDSVAVLREQDGMTRNAALPFERLCASLVYLAAVIVVAFAHGPMTPAVAGGVAPFVSLGGGTAEETAAFLCLPGGSGGEEDGAEISGPCEVCLVKAWQALPPDTPRLRDPATPAEMSPRPASPSLGTAALRAHRARAPPVAG